MFPRGCIRYERRCYPRGWKCVCVCVVFFVQWREGKKKRLGLGDESVSIVQQKKKEKVAASSTPSVNSHSLRVVTVCGLMIPRGVGKRWRGRTKWWQSGEEAHRQRARETVQTIEQRLAGARGDPSCRRCQEQSLRDHFRCSRSPGRKEWLPYGAARQIKQTLFKFPAKIFLWKIFRGKPHL